MQNIFYILAIVTLIMSVVTFILMRSDKNRARMGQTRIPERYLFLSAACFGAIGGTLGMHILRHKTNHWNFRAFFPTMMIIQIAVLGFLAIRTFT
jgi:uncharacterized membrane protein YsdA (DUF1294 family)